VLEELKKQVVPENDKGKGPITYLDIRRKQVLRASNPWFQQSMPRNGKKSEEKVSERISSLDGERSPSQNPVASLLTPPRGLLRKRR
jgi:hypothetical protein